jgi:exosortase
MCLIGGLMAVLYAVVVSDLAAEWWTQPAASYGMLIPPIVLCIAYLRRDNTFAIPVRPGLKGLWLVALGCALLLLGGLAGEFFLSRISLVVVLAGLVWTFWGWSRFRSLWSLFALLATMVPLPALVYNAAAAPLQLLASSLATHLAQSLGVSIYRDGNVIYLANISLGVAEACSGLQSLSAIVVASLLIGILENAVALGRILLFLFSVPLAIAMNIFRITGTALIADYHADFAMGFYHMFTGWLVFVVGCGALWQAAKLIFRWTRTD